MNSFRAYWGMDIPINAEEGSEAGSGWELKHDDQGSKVASDNEEMENTDTPNIRVGQQEDEARGTQGDGERDTTAETVGKEKKTMDNEHDNGHSNKNDGGGATEDASIESHTPPEITEEESDGAESVTPECVWC